MKTKRTRQTIAQVDKKQKVKRSPTRTVTLSPQLLWRYADHVAEQAQLQRSALGDQFNAVDFMAGAMVMYFFFRVQDRLPSSWVLRPLSGRDPFTGEKL